MKTFTRCLALPVLLTTACGTILRGTMEDVSIKSEPECKVYVDGAEYKTPVVVKLRRGNSHQITFEKEGYKTHTVNIDKRVSGGYLVADTLTGFFGIIVDFANGAVYSLDQNEVTATLEKKGVSFNADALDDDECYVVLADKGQASADVPTGHVLNENETSAATRVAPNPVTAGTTCANEVELNAFDVFFGNVNVRYERGIGEHATAFAGGGYCFHSILPLDQWYTWMHYGDNAAWKYASAAAGIRLFPTGKRRGLYVQAYGHLYRHYLREKATGATSEGTTYMPVITVGWRSVFAERVTLATSFGAGYHFGNVKVGITALDINEFQPRWDLNLGGLF